MELIRTYSEMIRYDTYDDRLRYLELGNGVGEATFGFDRYLNQAFYKSTEWGMVRQEVLIRDIGRDLGLEGYELMSSPIVHHMNPMSKEDIIEFKDWILDPEFLITVSHRTHNAIHYGINKIEVPSGPRSPGDTKLW